VHVLKILVLTISMEELVNRSKSNFFYKGSKTGETAGKCTCSTLTETTDCP